MKPKEFFAIACPNDRLILPTKSLLYRSASHYHLPVAAMRRVIAAMEPGKDIAELVAAERAKIKPSKRALAAEEWLRSQEQQQ